MLIQSMLIAFAVASAPTPASDEVSATTRINVRDLNLNQPDDVARLRSRVARGVQRVCFRVAPGMAISEIKARWRCERTARITAPARIALALNMPAGAAPQDVAAR